VKYCCYQDSSFLSSYKGLSMVKKINNCEHQALHSGTLSFTLLLLICNCIPVMNPLLACPHFPSHLGVLVFILGIAAQGGICYSSHIRILTNLHAPLSQEALVLSLQCLKDQFATKASLTKLLNSSFDACTKTPGCFGTYLGRRNLACCTTSSWPDNSVHSWALIW
jgi:hypothetical protein